jgi:hypothetical protein
MIFSGIVMQLPTLKFKFYTNLSLTGRHTTSNFFDTGTTMDHHQQRTFLLRIILLNFSQYAFNKGNGPGNWKNASFGRTRELIRVSKPHP